MDRTERIEDEGIRGELQGFFGKGKLKYDGGRVIMQHKVAEGLEDAIWC